MAVRSVIIVQTQASLQALHLDELVWFNLGTTLSSIIVYSDISPSVMTE